VSEALACLTVHAERLERDDVWRSVAKALDALERHDVRATFFVHPFQAIRADIDIGERIRELAARGHEIGQHTHFYATYDDGDGRVRKETRADAATVERCGDRDLAYLVAAGTKPAGFVSGGWAMSPDVMAWLEARGFGYDCSFRTYVPATVPHTTDVVSGPRRIGSVVEIPTTSTLRDEVRRFRLARSASVGDVRYHLSYLHDDDLLARLKHLAATRLRRWSLGGVRHVTAGEVAEWARDSLGAEARHER